MTQSWTRQWAAVTFRRARDCLYSRRASVLPHQATQLVDVTVRKLMWFCGNLTVCHWAVWFVSTDWSVCGCCIEWYKTYKSIWTPTDHQRQWREWTTRAPNWTVTSPCRCITQLQWATTVTSPWRRPTAAEVSRRQRLTVRYNQPASCALSGWPQTWKTWNTQGFLWTWKTPGILGEFCTTSGKIVTNKVFLIRHSNICIKQLLTG